MSNVTSLNGAEVHTGEPDPETVQLAKPIMEMADSGEITSLSLAHLNADHSVGHAFAGPEVTYGLLGCLTAQVSAMAAKPYKPRGS